MTAHAAGPKDHGTRANFDSRRIRVSRDNADDAAVGIRQEGRRLYSESELYTSVDGGLQQCCDHRVANDESPAAGIPEPIDRKPCG
jgi:hypothetical protein